MINTIFVKFNLENTLNLIHEFLTNVSNLMRFQFEIVNLFFIQKLVPRSESVIIYFM